MTLEQALSSAIRDQDSVVTSSNDSVQSESSSCYTISTNLQETHRKEEETRVKMTEDVRSPSFLRQLFVCGTIFTLSMSIGAGAGFSGVVIPQVNVHRRRMWSELFLT